MADSRCNLAEALVFCGFGVAEDVAEQARPESPMGAYRPDDRVGDTRNRQRVTMVGPPTGTSRSAR